MSLKEEFEISPKCPGCGTEITVLVAELENGMEVTCPGCGATIEFRGDASRAAEAVRALDQELSDLTKRR